jgi:hypothetical protein
MPRFAVIDLNSGTVINTIVADNLESLGDWAVEITAETNECSIGHQWDGTTFTDPNAQLFLELDPDLEPVPDPEPEADTHTVVP